MSVATPFELDVHVTAVLRRTLLAVVVVAVAIISAGHPAAAHSFLVSTTPGQGERLRSFPSAVVLEFSERPDPTTGVLELQRSNGDVVDLAGVQVAPAGVGMSAAVPGALEDGIYVVSWQAFSAIDGHGSFGEFSFAVGNVEGAVPAPVESSSSRWWDTLASWLFFSGLALAAGPLLTGLIDRGRHPRPVVRAGLLAALIGAGIAWLDIIRAGSNGVGPAALAVGLVALAMSADAATGRPLLPLVVLVGAAASWSARSHAASIEGVLGWALDVVHLAAGAAWAGALGVVVARGWAARRDGDRWLPVVARYAPVALPLVVALAIAGTISALLLIPTWRDLWETRYGQLLVVKLILFAGAGGFAIVSRRALRRRAATLLKRTTRAEAGLLAVALAVAGLVANATPPAPAVAAEALLGPPPLAGPIARTAGLAGQLNVELATDGERLDVRVFSPSGPVPGTEIEMSLRQPDGAVVDVLPRPCGPGCFAQQLDLLEGNTTAVLDAEAPGWTGGRFEGTLFWPPGDAASQRLREVIATTRSIDRLTVAETVDSGPGSVVTENIFEMSGDTLIDAEPYAAGNVDDVQRLPGASDRLSLYVPGSQIYAELTLDEHGRMVDSRLVSPGHEIRRRFRYPLADG